MKHEILMGAHSRRDFLRRSSLGVALALSSSPAKSAIKKELAQEQSANIHLETFKETKILPRDVTQARFVHNPRGPLNRDWALLGSNEGEASLVFDFGEEMVGRVTISGKCSVNSEFQLFYGEDLIEALNTTDRFPVPNWYRLPQDHFHLEPGSFRRESRGRRAFRYLNVVAKTGRVEISDVHLTQVHHAVRENIHFCCSDPLLNRIWQISARTTRLCMQRFYEDGVKRDGLLWIGDCRVEYLCNSLLFGDVDLARRSLQMMMETQNEDGSVPAAAIRSGGHQHPYNIDYMPDIQLPGGFLSRWVLTNYCTDLISAFREYYDFTGDWGLVRDSWPRLVRLISYLCNKVDLAAAVAERNFITDVQPESDQWWGSRGALAMNLCWAMRDGAELARRQGDSATEKICCDYLTQNVEAFPDRFWCPRRFVFRNETLADADTGWHVNALAILAGVVPDRAAARKLLKRVAALPEARQTYAGFMEFYKLQALWRSGLTKMALDECRSYWGHMLKYDATTTWEHCNRSLDGIVRKLTAPASHCHGWSAGPAYLFPAFLLGVQPEGAGFERVRFAPQLGDLAWAEGTVPTPKGDIFVHWEADPALHGVIELPQGLYGSAEIEGKRFELRPGKNPVMS
jgi:alpha-L-rhamnosidase